MLDFQQVASIGLFCAFGAAASAQPAPTAQFEVASVKLSSEQGNAGLGRVRGPRGCSGGPGTSDPGRWVCNSEPLSMLLRTAFDLRAYQFTPAAWMNDVWVDIVAKIPAASTPDQLLLMEQDLLATRFKLASHFEEMETSGYALIVGKGGVKFHSSTDDPPGYTAPPMPKTMDWDKTDGFPILPPGNETVLWALNGRVSSRWRKAPISQLVRYLAEQLKHPVTDATNLTGVYDITLRFVGAPIPIPGTRVERDANGEIIPPVINSRPTLTEAVESQLGLKLEPKTVTAKIFVVDHVEKVPLEN